ncbi:ABC transporter permease [Ruminococcus albus]|nr:ABC transporter permease [Ruminococcus albus]
MKAQKYQLLRSISTYVILLCSLIFIATILFAEISDQEIEKITGSMFVSYIGEINLVMLPMIILVYTAVIFGNDLSDKTVNYELLSGIKRSDVFFGRFFVVLVFNIAVYLIISVPPMLIFTALNGWGHTMTVKDVVIRYSLGLMPAIRYMAFYTFITMAVRNKAIVIGIGYVFSMITMLSTIMINELFDTKVTMYLFSIDIFDRLLNPKNMGYGFFNGEDVIVVKDILETDTIFHAAAASILGTAVFLLVGYAVMRRRDMN